MVGLKITDKKQKSGGGKDIKEGKNSSIRGIREQATQGKRAGEGEGVGPEHSVRGLAPGEKSVVFSVLRGWGESERRGAGGTQGQGPKQNACVVAPTGILLFLYGSYTTDVLCVWTRAGWKSARKEKNNSDGGSAVSIGTFLEHNVEPEKR